MTKEAVDHAEKAVRNIERYLERIKDRDDKAAQMVRPNLEGALALWQPILAAVVLHRDLEAKLGTLGHAVISLKDVQAFVAGDRAALDKYVGEPQYSGA